jgi:hypothetical protein
MGRFLVWVAGLVVRFALDFQINFYCITVLKNLLSGGLRLHL